MHVFYLITFVLLLAVCSNAQCCMPITGKAAAFSNSITTNVVSPTADIPIGSTVVIGVAIASTSVNVATVVDSVGNSYGTSAYAAVGNSNFVRQELWICSKTTSVISSTDTITITLNQPSSIVVTLEAYSGVTTVGPAYTTTPAAGGIASIAVQPSSSSSLLVAVFAGHGPKIFTQNVGTLRQSGHIGLLSLGGALTDNFGLGIVSNIVTAYPTGSWVGTVLELD